MDTQTYKIKRADKAALLNKLEKFGVTVDSFSIVDNKLLDYFELSVTNPNAAELIKRILNQSSKIDQLKEVIKNIIKKEISK